MKKRDKGVTEWRGGKDPLRYSRSTLEGFERARWTLGKPIREMGRCHPGVV